MTPTAEWYEADADDSDRSVTDDITASAPEPARGFSDADLLRRRTAALNRTSAENERLRAEVERLRQGLWDVWAALGFDTDGDTGPGAWIAGSGVDSFIATVVKDAAEYRRETEDDYASDTDALTARAEAAEAKLRDVEAERDALRAVVEQARQWIVNCVDPAAVGVEVKRDMLATLARSQAPQAPAEQEGRGVLHEIGCSVCAAGGPEAREFHRSRTDKPNRLAPSVRPATADDEGVRS